MAKSGQGSEKHVGLGGRTLLDGSGGKPIFNSVVLIRGERIEKVGTVGEITVPAGYEKSPLKA